jgi:hypothetical protein
MCHTFAGTKPVFYQWTKNGQVLANSPQSDYKIETFEDNSQFVIKSVDRTDSGNYSCIARNAFGTDSQSALLIVKGLKNSFRNKIYSKIISYKIISVGPKWLIEPKDMTINADNDITIECKADGEPKPKISWVHSNGNF